MLQVLADYHYIMVKLNEKPLSIEHIYEIREWMETIPISLRTLEDVAKRLIMVSNYAYKQVFF